MILKTMMITVTRKMIIEYGVIQKVRSSGGGRGGSLKSELK